MERGWERNVRRRNKKKKLPCKLNLHSDGVRAQSQVRESIRRNFFHAASRHFFWGPIPPPPLLALALLEFLFPFSTRRCNYLVFDTRQRRLKVAKDDDERPLKNKSHTQDHVVLNQGKFFVICASVSGD